MNRTTRLSLAAALLVAVTSHAWAGGNLPLEKVPEKPRAAITKAMGAGRIDEISMKLHDGKTVFDAEFIIDGKEHGIVVTEAGDVVEETVEVPQVDVPAAAIAEAKRLYPKAAIDETEKVTAGGKTLFRVSIELEKDQERELDFDPAGKLIADREDVDD